MTAVTERIKHSRKVRAQLSSADSITCHRPVARRGDGRDDVW